MSVSRRQSMVNPGHAQLSVVRQCRLLKVVRSSLYYEKAGESAINRTLMQEIDRAFTEWPFFGVRQMCRYLVSLGYCVGRKRVRRLMRLMGFMAIYQKPKTSVPNPEHKRYPYLLRDLTIARSNQVWCSDITYIPMRKGFLYLVAIMDWHSRKVLSWRLSNTMEADFCIVALEEALEKYGTPDIFNTDQGSQFTSVAFTNVLRNNGIRIIAVRLRGNKKVQNLSSMWYKKLPQQLATQGDFGLEPSYYTLLSTAIPDTGTCF